MLYDDISIQMVSNTFTIKLKIISKVYVFLKVYKKNKVVKYF